MSVMTERPTHASGVIRPTPTLATVNVNVSSFPPPDFVSELKQLNVQLLHLRYISLQSLHTQMPQVAESIISIHSLPDKCMQTGIVTATEGVLHMLPHTATINPLITPITVSVVCERRDPAGSTVNPSAMPAFTGVLGPSSTPSSLLGTSVLQRPTPLVPCTNQSSPSSVQQSASALMPAPMLSFPVSFGTSHSAFSSGAGMPPSQAAPCNTALTSIVLSPYNSTLNQGTAVVPMSALNTTGSGGGITTLNWVTPAASPLPALSSATPAALTSLSPVVPLSTSATASTASSPLSTPAVVLPAPLSSSFSLSSLTQQPQQQQQQHSPSSVPPLIHVSSLFSQLANSTAAMTLNTPTATSAFSVPVTPTPPAQSTSSNPPPASTLNVSPLSSSSRSRLSHRHSDGDQHNTLNTQIKRDRATVIPNESTTSEQPPLFHHASSSSLASPPGSDAKPADVPPPLDTQSSASSATSLPSSSPSSLSTPGGADSTPTSAQTPSIVRGAADSPSIAATSTTSTSTSSTSNAASSPSSSTRSRGHHRFGSTGSWTAVPITSHQRGDSGTVVFTSSELSTLSAETAAMNNADADDESDSIGNKEEHEHEHEGSDDEDMITTNSGELSAAGLSSLPVSASHKGTSCHQCKNTKPLKKLAFCANMFDKRTKPEKRGCRKKYCETCLKKFYNDNLADVINNKNWICASCRGVCCCAACTRTVNKKKKSIELPSYAVAHSPSSTAPTDSSHPLPSPALSPRNTAPVALSTVPQQLSRLNYLSQGTLLDWNATATTTTTTPAAVVTPLNLSVQQQQFLVLQQFQQQQQQQQQQQFLLQAQQQQQQVLQQQAQLAAATHFFSLTPSVSPFTTTLHPSSLAVPLNVFSATNPLDNESGGIRFQSYQEATTVTSLPSSPALSTTSFVVRPRASTAESAAAGKAASPSTTKRMFLKHRDWPYASTSSPASANRQISDSDTEKGMSPNTTHREANTAASTSTSTSNSNSPLWTAASRRLSTTTTISSSDGDTQMMDESEHDRAPTQQQQQHLTAFASFSSRKNEALEKEKQQQQHQQSQQQQQQQQQQQAQEDQPRAEASAKQST